ncbi:MAG: calcium-binding protein [Pseudomonadota bacterium]
MTDTTHLGEVGGLEIAAPESTVDGLTIADRAIQNVRLLTLLPGTVNQRFVDIHIPGPLVDQGTSFLAETSLVAAGQDILIPLNIRVAISTAESEVVGEDASVNILPFAAPPTALDLSVTINGEDLEQTLGVDLVDFRETYGDDPDAVEPTVGGPLAADNSAFFPGLGGVDVPLDPDALTALGIEPEFLGASQVVDGQHLLIKDVPVGTHTIVVTGELDNDNDGVADESFVTNYTVEVVDPVIGTDHKDILFGFGGNDIVDGNAGNDLLFGGWGNDRVEGDEGHDKLFGGHGDDVILAGTGHDRAFGGRGDDVILLGDGNDRAFGGKGNDILLGEEGNDWLSGGRGDDILAAGAGHDVLRGGQGSDIFQFAFGDGEDKILDFDVDNDVIQFFGAVLGGFGSFDELVIEQDGRHTSISYGNNTDPEHVLLRGVDAGDLSENSFLFS